MLQKSNRMAVRSNWQGEAERMKYTRVKLGGHLAYDSQGASAVHVLKAELLWETAQKMERNILKQ